MEADIMLKIGKREEKRKKRVYVGVRSLRNDVG